MAEPLLVAKARNPIYLLPGLANRHGLIAGATGTGKTVTLQRLAESFSRIGVPAFMADVKGDLAGISQRGLLTLETQGGDKLFGEPALDVHDFMRVDSRGHGFVSVLAAEKLMNAPKLYAALLLWLLSELFEHMPEVGDPEKPKLVFFF